MVKEFAEGEKKKLICEICKKDHIIRSFKTKSSLYRHNRDKHLNIKKCPYCNRGLIALEKHIMICPSRSKYHYVTSNNITKNNNTHYFNENEEQKSDEIVNIEKDNESSENIYIREETKSDIKNYNNYFIKRDEQELEDITDSKKGSEISENSLIKEEKEESKFNSSIYIPNYEEIKEKNEEEKNIIKINEKEDDYNEKLVRIVKLNIFLSLQLLDLIKQKKKNKK